MTGGLHLAQWRSCTCPQRQKAFHESVRGLKMGLNIALSSVSLAWPCSRSSPLVSTHHINQIPIFFTCPYITSIAKIIVGEGARSLSSPVTGVRNILFVVDLLSQGPSDDASNANKCWAIARRIGKDEVSFH